MYCVFSFQVPEFLLITFAVCTVLLIAVHMLALMISTCILPNVEAIANLHYQTQKTVFESPHVKMSFIVELAWGFSTVIGELLIKPSTYYVRNDTMVKWMFFQQIRSIILWMGQDQSLILRLHKRSYFFQFYLLFTKNLKNLGFQNHVPSRS